CGAAVSAGISVPQFLLVVRTKVTHGLSLAAWVITLGTLIGWLGHGIKLAEPNMIWPNIWSLITAGTVLYFLRRNGRYTSLATLLPGLALGALLVSLDNLVGSAVFGIVAMVPAVYGMIRQGIALMHAREVTGVSVWAWILQVVCQGTWLTWAVMADEIGTLISASVTIVAAAYVLTWRILRAAGLGPVGARP
ncbi:MAG: hypothetical protein LBI33_03845, partial [Propionibacteriaceae bacterium]|nr:hypothetical protein [Propionibacteriaceae bacterium]